MTSKVTFVVGGAASGKSAYAEALAERANMPKVYLATAQAFDDEMRRKVAQHVTQRGPGWTTMEAPLETATALAGLGSDQLCLLDCATMWLSNQMMAERDLADAQKSLIDSILACPARLIIVSNEVGGGIVPDNALARSFREAQGRLNIALAAASDVVVQVTVGLPTVLKGQLP